MLEIFVGLVALLLALPFVVLSVEAGAALFARKHEISSRKPRLAVLIPAHNEASEIEATIRSVRGEIGVGDRIVVVSDNSTDATGELAEELGAQVVTRIDPDHFGKGYALEAGIRHLSLDPPEVVIVVDADCRPESGAIARIATRAKAEGRAIQGASLVRPAEDAFLPKVSALAFHIRNEVRPRGLARLDLPVLLQGTGMAIPWLQIAEADLGGSHLAEDRKLGIALALDERTPRAEPEARFWSALETGGSVADGQRSRWERGHLAAIREDVPRLLRAAVHQRRPELCALAAELAVPPLTLLLGAWVVSLLAAAVIASSAPLACALVLPGAIAFGLLALASMRSLSTPISSRFLLAAPLYALAKVPLYLRAVRRQSVGWQRAKRPTEPRKADAPAHASDVETYQIGGVDVHPLTESECVTRILDSCDAGRGGWVVTPNVDFLERSNRDSGFRALLRPPGRV
jgi:cellulose synthase/poly-beta-1,6-N-acetylglucosamine synthase-like glycosyltransferase